MQRRPNRRPAGSSFWTRFSVCDVRPCSCPPQSTRLSGREPDDTTSAICRHPRHLHVKQNRARDHAPSVGITRTTVSAFDSTPARDRTNPDPTRNGSRTLPSTARADLPSTHCPTANADTVQRPFSLGAGSFLPRCSRPSREFWSASKSMAITARYVGISASVPSGHSNARAVRRGHAGRIRAGSNSGNSVSSDGQAATALQQLIRGDHSRIMELQVFMRHATLSKLARADASRAIRYLAMLSLLSWPAAPSAVHVAS